MPNNGEELAYWYLRLNGFFPIANFVVHRTRSVRYSGDVDLIGIRLPHVYEDVGGKPQDWDAALFSLFKRRLPLGVICEVKTGHFDTNTVFRDEFLSYSVGRLGFTAHYDEVVRDVSNRALTVLPRRFQIAKLLFTNTSPAIEISEERSFYHVPLSHVRKFIRTRIARYPREKFGDRMFFGSALVQELIDTTVLELGSRQPTRR